MSQVVRIYKGNSLIYEDSCQTLIPAHACSTRQFRTVLLDTGDYHIIATISIPTGDRDTTNNRMAEYFECWGEILKRRDIVMKEILSPRGEYLEGNLLRPSVRVANEGNYIETFDCHFLIPPYYNKTLTICGLLPDEERCLSFPTLLLPAGQYTCQAFISTPPLSRIRRTIP